MLHLETSAQDRTRAVEREKIARLGAHIEDRKTSASHSSLCFDYGLTITPLGFERFEIPWRGER